MNEKKRQNSRKKRTQKEIAAVRAAIEQLNDGKESVN